LWLFDLERLARAAFSTIAMMTCRTFGSLIWKKAFIGLSAATSSKLKSKSKVIAWLSGLGIASAARSLFEGKLGCNQGAALLGDFNIRHHSSQNSTLLADRVQLSLAARSGIANRQQDHFP
jgi:hypothetical protein